MRGHCSNGSKTASFQADTPFPAYEIPNMDVHNIMGSDELAYAFDGISEQLASDMGSQDLPPESSLPVSSSDVPSPLSGILFFRVDS